MEKNSKNSYNTYISIGCITLIWILYALYTNTLITGFHFTDDHEFYRIATSLDNNGLFKTIQIILAEDLNIRFRPFYYLHRILTIYVFGINYTLLSLYNIFLAIVCSCTLFLTARKFKFNAITSFIFTAIILVGPQIEIWYRKGPSETLGMTLLSICILFLVKAVKESKTSYLWFSIFILILSSLTKESFTLFIPIYILIYLGLSTKDFSVRMLISTFFKKYKIIALVSIVFFLEIAIILKFVGTNKIGYAGVDETTSLFHIIITGYYFLRTHKIIYLIPLLLVAFFIILLLIKNKNIPKILNPILYISLGVLLLWIPQFYIFNQTGLIYRYLIPSTLGIAVLYLVTVKMFKYQERYRSILLSCYQILICILLIFHFKNNSLPIALKFAKETKDISYLLDTVKSKTSKNDTVTVMLSASKNYEWGQSILTYLNYYGYQNIHFNITTEVAPFNPFEQYLEEDFKTKYAEKIYTSSNVFDKKQTIVILPYSQNNIDYDRLSKFATHSQKISEYYLILKDPK